jgi:hypothetical protein
MTKQDDLGARLAARLNCGDLRGAVLAARARTGKHYSTCVEPSGLFSVNIVNYYGTQSSVDYLTGALTMAETIEFLEAAR